VAVLTVDDHEPFRVATRAVLADMPGFEAVGEAASGEEALDRAATLRPDLVLLDLNMPGIGGLETSRRLTSGSTSAVVFLVSVDDEPPPEAVRASSGVAAFIRKQDLCPTLLSDLWSRFGPGLSLADRRRQMSEDFQLLLGVIRMALACQ
jgi:DNA-binding NarL/FixJ family response regulator